MVCAPAHSTETGRPFSRNSMVLVVGPAVTTPLKRLRKVTQQEQTRAGDVDPRRATFRRTRYVDQSSTGNGGQSPRLRESQVHFTGGGIGPPAGYNLCLGVKLHSLRSIHMEVSEEPGFSPPQTLI